MFLISYNDKDISLPNVNQQESHKPSMYKRQILTKTNYPIVVSQPYKINNKDICTGVDKVSCIVMVHTAPGHFESPF